MVLIDTSAWIEFLRNTGSPACNQVESLLAGEPFVCEPVTMEILAGARDEVHLAELRRLLARCVTLQTTSGDYEFAAAVYRECRRNGRTPRKITDCLIAAVAIRHDVALLHHDRDFESLSQHSALRLAH
jgi:predicted nucleic acid-binding protein